MMAENMGKWNEGYDRRAAEGFTLIELMIVLGITALVAIPLALSLFGFRAERGLQDDTRVLVEMLRDAQQRSITQENGATWAVRLDGDAVPPIYELYESPYASAAAVRRLSPGIDFYDAADPPALLYSVTEFAFEKISGAYSAGDTSFKLCFINDTSNCTVITVRANGTVTY